MRTAIREDKTAQDILKEISLGDIKEFTKKDRFLLILRKNLCANKAPKRDYY